MTFSILFWNIWLDNQANGVQHSSKLLDELKRLSDEYHPDFIGLNEVLQSVDADTPFVIDFLKSECGYEYAKFAAASPLTPQWLIGTALCSRVEFDSVAAVRISNDSPATRRGYSGQSVKAVAATVTLPGRQPIHIVVAHPMHLRPHTLRDHYEATANLELLVRSDTYAQNTILGGDFNEPGFMPKSFKHKVSDILHLKTGTSVDTTWRHNAWSFTPIRANLDQLYWTKDSNFKLKRFEVLHTKVSDHRPLLASFEFQAA